MWAQVVSAALGVWLLAAPAVLLRQYPHFHAPLVSPWAHDALGREQAAGRSPWRAFWGLGRRP
jgi:hypothetical protein